ncbi:MAG: hypothetical protein ChlgKO_05320 [Chlamydiales bacterium]
MSTGAISNKAEVDFDPFLDPITHEIIIKAVILPCGHTFGANSITVWIRDENHQTCPTCSHSTTLTDLVPNFALREAIEAFPNFAKKQVAQAVDEQTEGLRNTFRRAMEKKEKEMEDMQTPTGSEIVVDWRRIYNHQKKIEDENSKKGIHSYSGGSHLFASYVEEHRHLSLHKALSDEYSSEENQNTLIKLFLPNEFAQKDGFGRTPLHLAVKHNLGQPLQNILKKMLPEDLAIQDVTGSTSLHYAAGANNYKNEMHHVIKAMRPEDLAITDENGKTFMHRFSFCSEKAAFFTPILEKVTPEMLGTIDSEGYTPLHYAIKRGIGYGDRDQIIEAICKKMRPEDLNKIYTNGENFLHFIIKNNNPLIVKTLVKYMNESAKKEKDQDGKTPIELLDANCQTNSYYRESRIVLIYREPIDQISGSLQFNMGEKVYHTINRSFGVGTISETKYDLDTQTVTYGVIFPDMNSLKMTVKGEDLEKA